MHYLGIDQSYRSTGLVLLDSNKNIASYEVVSTLKEDGDYFTRAKMTSESIASYISNLNLEMKIGIEGLAFGMRGHTLQNLAGLQFMIVNAVRDFGHTITVFTPSNVKKTATGNGRASKQEMYDKLPEKPKAMFDKITKTNGREDLTDAYWIALSAKGNQ